MTIPKRGSRRIVVDETAYRWRLRRRPTAAQRDARSPLLVAVSAEEGPGPTLVAQLGRAHPRNRAGHYSETVTPAEVAGLIREGLKLGWDPLRPGRQFTLDPGASGVAGRVPLPQRIFPPGLRPPDRAGLERLAKARPPEERDIFRIVDRRDSPPRRCGGSGASSGLEINGVDLIELVYAAELPHAKREIITRREKGDTTPLSPENLAGDYLSFPGSSRHGRGLFDRTVSYAHHFGLEDDDPRLHKATLLGCTCGIIECWFLLAAITILDDVVIWSDFEQFHRPWIYDLGPFIFDKADYLRAIELPP